MGLGLCRPCYPRSCARGLMLLILIITDRQTEAPRAEATSPTSVHPPHRPRLRHWPPQVSLAQLLTHSLPEPSQPASPRPGGHFPRIAHVGTGPRSLSRLWDPVHGLLALVPVGQSPAPPPEHPTLPPTRPGQATPPKRPGPSLKGRTGRGSRMGQQDGAEEEILPQP